MTLLKTKRILIMVAAIVCMFAIATSSMAGTADISLSSSSDLGSGWWQYDYLFTNTSASDYIYSMRLTFDSSVEFVSLSTPANWNGIAGSPTTTFAMTYSPSIFYDIAPSASTSTSFKVRNYSGDFDYTMYFDNHAGQRTQLSGTLVQPTAPVVPEPVSAVLFMVGGGAMGVRSFLRKRK